MGMVSLIWRWKPCWYSIVDHSWGKMCESLFLKWTQPMNYWNIFFAFSIALGHQCGLRESREWRLAFTRVSHGQRPTWLRRRNFSLSYLILLQKVTWLFIVGLLSHRLKKQGHCNISTKTIGAVWSPRISSMRPSWIPQTPFDCYDGSSVRPALHRQASTNLTLLKKQYVSLSYHSVCAMVMSSYNCPWDIATKLACFENARYIYGE